MYVHVERWVARPAWLALSIPDRISYLDQMESGIRRLLDSGARPIGVVLKEETTPADTVHYGAVWVMPEGSAQVRLLESILEVCGWHDYFRPASDRAAGQARKTLFEYADELGASARVSPAQRN
jgi:hypothetical protein